MKPALIISDVHEVEEKLVKNAFHQELNRFRNADEQQKIMKQLKLDGISHMTLAVSDEWIVGYAVALPPEKEERWSQIPYVSMLGGIEIAPVFRKQGLGKQLLKRLLESKSYEEKILVSLEYYWHWDLQNSQLGVYEYKHMLKGLLSSVGMEQFYTDDPDINAHSANFMMAYVGKNISGSQLEQLMYLANPKVF